MGIDCTAGDLKCVKAALPDCKDDDDICLTAWDDSLEERRKLIKQKRASQAKAKAHKGIKIHKKDRD
jgi:hypothetical protein